MENNNSFDNIIETFEKIDNTLDKVTIRLNSIEERLDTLLKVVTESNKNSSLK